MGSLLVWDLRAKPKEPMQHSIQANNFTDGGNVDQLCADEDIKHFQGPVWLDAMFSTDLYSLSGGAKAGVALDSDETDDTLSRIGGDSAGSMHSSEISCVRCSEGMGSDSLIFALDVSGVVTFWRLIELASVQGSMVKLALQGSLSVTQGTGALCSFLSAKCLCIHPQQQLQCVVASTAGLHQAYRVRLASLSEGPRVLHSTANAGIRANDPSPSAEAAADAAPPRDQLEDIDHERLGSGAEPLAAAFNPFFPGLLLAVYADGDLVLYDTSLCVPIVHWASAVGVTLELTVSVAWSPTRPCVFVVKSGSSLDVWDLAENTSGPVMVTDLAKELATPTCASWSHAICNEVGMTPQGQVMVSHGEFVAVFALPARLATPLTQAANQRGAHEQPIEALMLEGANPVPTFPSLSRYHRGMEVPPQCLLEKDILQRVLASAHPLQALGCRQP
jgi:WD40 repeat protein